MKFEKIRERIEKMPERRRRTYPLDKLEELGEKVPIVDEITLDFSLRWTEYGMEISGEGEYIVSGDMFLHPIEKYYSNDGMYNKEAAVLARALNSVPNLRYELCFLEEYRLQGILRDDLFTDRSNIIPCFVCTEGIHGIKEHMNYLGFDCTGTTNLKFRRKQGNFPVKTLLGEKT
jgi:hypothetical protein|nr:MAG TPA: hypothetical protein [Caudoviricetes sp.]